MKKILLLLVISLFSLYGYSQIYLGKTKEEINVLINQSYIKRENTIGSDAALTYSYANGDIFTYFFEKGVRNNACLLAGSDRLVYNLLIYLRKNAVLLGDNKWVEKYNDMSVLINVINNKGVILFLFRIVDQ